jgi:predicted HNH restriction endonuclease
MATYFVNTDAVSNAGSSLHDEWIKRGVAVTGGGEKWRRDLMRIRRDDSVLMYANGVGVVAQGVALDDEVIDVGSDQVVNPAEKIEYHKRVRWDLDLTREPISPAELRRVLGWAPVNAVQHVVKGEDALAAYIRSLASQPTANNDEYVRVAQRLLERGPVGRPQGVEKPARIEAVATVFFRDPRVRAWTLQRADGRCELCGLQAPFRMDAGLPYLESHHIVPLAEGGPDTPINSAAVCPNCHRELHHGEGRAGKRELLRGLIVRREAEQNGD